MKKYGGFIPGIRPGEPTMIYIDKVMSRITLAGAIFLAFIAILPNFIGNITGIQGVYFGGTSLLIVVGVALDTMRQAPVSYTHLDVYKRQALWLMQKTITI